MLSTLDYWPEHSYEMRPALFQTVYPNHQPADFYFAYMYAQMFHRLGGIFPNSLYVRFIMEFPNRHTATFTEEKY